MGRRGIDKKSKKDREREKESKIEIERGGKTEREGESLTN